MKKLTHAQLPSFPPRNLEKVRDLIYFDGPLLSHFRDEYRRDYIYFWCEADEKYNRWMVVSVTQKQLDSYYQRETSLYELLTSPSSGFVYYIDIDDNIDICKVYLAIASEIDYEYLPQKDVRYKSSGQNNSIPDEPKFRLK